MSFRKALSLFVALFAFAAAGSAWRRPPRRTAPQPAPAHRGRRQDRGDRILLVRLPALLRARAAVNAWLKTAPKDVVFKRVPAIPSESWASWASIYYTLEAMGLLDKYHDKVFEAVHKQSVNLVNKSKRDDWLKANGIDPAKYAEVEKSFSVASKVARARQLTQAYKVDSVPRVVVNGKYVTSAEQAGSGDKIFPAVDQLVAMARKEKS
jgi:DSBA-like thioredoxin domain.